MDPLWFIFVCLLYLFVFVCYFQGSRHLRRRGEADRFSSWRGAESRQAHLCQTSEDPVSVRNKAGEEEDWPIWKQDAQILQLKQSSLFYLQHNSYFVYVKLQVQRWGRGCRRWQNHWGEISNRLQKVPVWSLGCLWKALLTHAALFFSCRCNRNGGRWRPTLGWTRSSCCRLSICLEESWWDAK